MTAQFPGTQRADLQVVRDGEPSTGGDVTAQALGLLENARKVADATVAEARDEAERLLTAARERAQQVQRDAKELGQKLRADAERDAAQARHQAYGESERILGEARTEVTTLKSSVSGLREERDAAEAAMRELAGRLQVALDRYADQNPQQDQHHDGEHHDGEHHQDHDHQG
jgi:vacuolar-type H+-ATPase subunit H